MVLSLTVGAVFRATSGVLLMALWVAIIFIRPRRRANVTFAAFSFFLGTPYLFRNLFYDTARTAIVAAVTAPLFSLAGIAPLQRLAERVADKAMPGVKDAGAMDVEERAALYRNQAQVAWSDGSLSSDERDLLNAAREARARSRTRAEERL